MASSRISPGDAELLMDVVRFNDWMFMGGVDMDTAASLLEGGVQTSVRPKLWKQIARLWGEHTPTELAGARRVCSKERC